MRARKKLEATRDFGSFKAMEPSSASFVQSANVHPLHRLGHSIGNQAVLRMLNSTATIQPKLAINHPGDQYEQEADRVAEQVTCMPAPSNSLPSVGVAPRAVSGLQRKCACGGSCNSCKAEEEDDARHRLQRKSEAGASPPTSALPTAPRIVHDVLRSHGQSLDAATRARFEPRFGHDFSRTRVHVGTLAAQSASALNALAYTVGEHVVFAGGQYSPGDPSGQRLLAHELAHVVQQSRTGAEGPQLAINEPADPSEREAEAAADSALARRNTMLRLRAVPGGRIQRTCGRALGKPAKSCTPSQTGIIGLQFLFDFACDTLRSFEVDHLAEIKKTIPPGSPLNVHGYASADGDASFNQDLSCHRANKLAALILGTRPDCSVYELFAHGPQSGPPGLEFWRAASVEIARTPSVPYKGQPHDIPACPDVPTSVPSTCNGRHEGYAAAQRCFPLNSWLPCVARTSANICRVIEAFNFRGDEGQKLSLCVGAQPGASRDRVRAKGKWFNDTNACIWRHWRDALEPMHDPSMPISSTITPEWAEAIKVCRREGVGSTECCEAHVWAEQMAIEHCGSYDAGRFGRLPTDVPGAPYCSDAVLLASGPLPFSGNFEDPEDRIDYGNFICCGM